MMNEIYIYIWGQKLCMHRQSTPFQMSDELNELNDFRREWQDEVIMKTMGLSLIDTTKTSHQLNHYIETEEHTQSFPSPQEDKRSKQPSIHLVYTEQPSNKNDSSSPALEMYIKATEHERFFIR